MDIFPRIILVILLIILNGFFAASEYAIVAVRKTRIDELVGKGDILAKMVQKALENREDMISTTQLGTTIVSLILGWIGEPVIAQIFLSLLTFLPKNLYLLVAHTLAVISSLFVLTFLSILIGELVPKTISLYKAELVSLIIVAPLSFLVKMSKPFIKILNKSANTILRVLGFSAPSGEKLIYSKEELKMILNQVGESGMVGKKEVTMIQNVFRLSDRSINQLMTARNEIIAFRIDMVLNKLTRYFDKGFSRYPIYNKSLDDIKGFIHVKDVYNEINKKRGNLKLSEIDIIRKIISVPETKKANAVLSDMQKKHIHMAIVYDEYGVMVGIVTLEDIIESLIGDIQDEFDKQISGIRRNSDGSYLIDGSVELERFQKRFRLGIKGQSYSTIGGLVFGVLGREPRRNDKITIGHFVFEIQLIDGKRIKSMLLRRELDKPAS